MITFEHNFCMPMKRELMITGNGDRVWRPYLRHRLHASDMHPTVSYCFTSDLVVATRNVKGQSNGIDLVKGIYLFLHWRYDQMNEKK